MTKCDVDDVCGEDEENVDIAVGDCVDVNVVETLDTDVSGDDAEAAADIL